MSIHTASRSEKDSQKKYTESHQIYRRLLRYLKPHRKRFVLALLAMLLFGSTDGAVPYILKRILDDIFGAQKTDMLWMLVVGIVGFTIVRAVIGFFQRYLATSVGLRVIEDLRNEIGGHLLRLSSNFYSRHTTGSLLSRMTNDTMLVRSAITETSVSLVRDTTRIVALLISAFFLDPVLALIAFVVFPIGVLPVIRFGRKVRRLSRTGQAQLGGLTSIMHEIIIGHTIVQSFTMEDYEHRRFAEENHRSTETLERAAKYGAISGPTNEILASFAIAAIIVYGGMSVISGVRTQGEFIAFLTAIFLLYEPIKNLGRLNNAVQTGVAAADRIFEILDSVPEISDSENAVPLIGSDFSVEYKNVWFRYPRDIEPVVDSEEDISSPLLVGEREWALQDISLTVNRGETLALVGMSGGGKSTLVTLLPRFFNPDRGEIRIGGQNINLYTLSSLRQAISVVSQHTFLFNETVYQNIAYGRLNASQSEVIAAAKAANAHDFICRLPEGYQSIIGEQGLRLSGGERARIAIARALLKDSPILVLDEATASLDSESEKLVQAAIELLMQGRTVLVIAHRLSTIRKADKIAVIVDGRIAEIGTHQELLLRKGEYAKLCRLQFHYDLEPEQQITLA